MTTTPAAPRLPAALPSRTTRRWGRVAVGALIVVVGVGWLLDGFEVSVPWRALPATGLIVVGVIIAVAGRVRGWSAVLGALLLAAALIAALPVRGYTGPVGERAVAPGPGDWPVEQNIGVGSLRVDLTGRELPVGGRVEVRVGVGDLRVVVPSGIPVRIDAVVELGDIKVDGVSVDNGFDARWGQDVADPRPIQLMAWVGVGSLEVRHG
jgi:hypothetical protein